MAEREGFEPRVVLLLYRLSKRAKKQSVELIYLVINKG